MSRMAVTGMLRQRGLQILFALAFAWLALLIGWLLVDFYDIEQESADSYLKTGCAVALLLAGLVCRRWPGFMNLPASISLLSALGRFIQAFVIAIVLVPLFFGIHAWYFDYDPNSTNPQADMIVISAAYWYGVFFTPVVTVVLTWYLSVRAPGRGELRKGLVSWAFFFWQSGGGNGIFEEIQYRYSLPDPCYNLVVFFSI